MWQYCHDAQQTFLEKRSLPPDSIWLQQWIGRVQSSEVKVISVNWQRVSGVFTGIRTHLNSSELIVCVY